MTTGIGNQGLNLIDGYHCMIAEDAQAFAAKVIEIYTNKTLWKKLSQHSLEYMKDHFSKEVAKELVLKAFQS